MSVALRAASLHLTFRGASALCVAALLAFKLCQILNQIAHDTVRYPLCSSNQA